MPSPISDMRRWTRKTPTSGAARPASRAASRACRMKSSARISPTGLAGGCGRGVAPMTGWGSPSWVGSWWWIDPGSCAARCAVVLRAACPSKSIRPASMHTTLVTTSRSASSSWVTTTIEVPPAASRSRTTARASWLAVSTPAVGSSMTSTSGRPGQGAGDEDPPLLAPGQPCDLLVRPVGEPDRSDRLADHLVVQPGLRAPPRPVGEPADLDDLGDRGADRGRQRVVLGDVADAGELPEAFPGNTRAAAPRRPAVPPVRAAHAPGSTCRTRWGRAAPRPHPRAP